MPRMLSCKDWRMPVRAQDSVWCMTCCPQGQPLCMVGLLIGVFMFARAWSGITAGEG